MSTSILRCIHLKLVKNLHSAYLDKMMRAMSTLLRRNWPVAATTVFYNFFLELASSHVFTPWIFERPSLHDRFLYKITSLCSVKVQRLAIVALFVEYINISMARTFNVLSTESQQYGVLLVPLWRHLRAIDDVFTIFLFNTYVGIVNAFAP